MEIEIVLLSFVALVTIAFGFNIFLKAKRKDKRLLILFSLIISQLFWAVTILLTLGFYNRSGWNLLFTRSSFAAGILIAGLFYALALQFHKFKRLVILPITVLVCNSLLFGLSFTNLVVSKVEVFDDQLKSFQGPLYLLYAITLAATFIYALTLIYNGYKLSTDRNAKEQLRYVFVGALISVALSFISNLIVPLMGYEIRSLGPIFMLFFIGCTFYAITRHRFLRLNLALIDILVACSLCLIPFSAFFFFYDVNTRLWGSIHTMPAYIMGMGEAFIFVYGFIFSQKYFNLFMDKYFRKGYVQMEKLTEDLKVKLTKSIDINEVSLLLEGYFTVLNIKNYALFSLKNNSFSYYLCNNCRQLDESLVSFIKACFEKYGKDTVDISEIWDKSDNDSYTTFEKNGIELVFNLDAENYLMFYSKDDGSTYSAYEINLVKSIIENLGLALQRVALYNEQKQFSETLQKKVDEYTSELQEKYQQERDMIGIIGHELRTPLTVAKGNGELALSKIQALPDKEVKEKIEHKVKLMFNSILHASELIETMLSTSHVDNSQFDLNISEFNIGDVISEVIQNNLQAAKDKNLYLKYTPTSLLIQNVLSDQRRISEVINNLVTNAIKYTNQGGITVSVTENEDAFKIHVQDTGIGIPESEIKNLGKKFYRVHQHLDNQGQVVRAGGTGLGLYVVKGILHALHGTLEIQSIEDKGSTFTIVLPKSDTPQSQISIQNQQTEELDMFVKLGLKK